MDYKKAMKVAAGKPAPFKVKAPTSVTKKKMKPLKKSWVGAFRLDDEDIELDFVPVNTPDGIGGGDGGIIGDGGGDGGGMGESTCRKRNITEEGGSSSKLKIKLDDVDDIRDNDVSAITTPLEKYNRIELFTELD